MPLRNNLVKISTDIWDFILDLENGNLSDSELDMETSVAIHDIVEAAEKIVSEKVEIYKILNNSD